MNIKKMLMIMIIALLFTSCESGFEDMMDEAKVYDNSVVYNLRDTGPAGGIIFYINPDYEADGWRYLEAYPVDIAVTGWSNALAIIGAYQPGDWYIPSIAEMEYLYNNLVFHDTIGADVSDNYKFWINGYASNSVNPPATCYLVYFYQQPATQPYTPAFSYPGTTAPGSNYLWYRAIRKF